MKQYPTIPKEIQNISIYAWDKLDGSNVRVEWSSKKGFYKYGTRHRLLGQDDPVLGEAIKLISPYEDILKRLLRRESHGDNVVLFFEFFGDNSFAGNHVQNEQHYAMLIDVSLYKHGLIDPSDLREWIELTNGPNLLHHGKPDGDFVQQVRNGTLPGMTFEGVVCKANINKQRVMFKIKSTAWLNKLHTFCNGDKELFEQLA